MAKETKKTEGRPRWRIALAFAAAAAIGVSTAMAARRVHHFVITDPQFVLSRERPECLRIEGLRYAPRAKVVRVFSPDFERSIFSIPLPERRRRLLAIDWVEEASVSRVWPDRLVVRIRERQPVAFVYLRSGVLLVDGHGVLLEQPQQARFAFPVLSGIRDDQTEHERALRVRAMLRVLHDLGPRAKDISEVNVADPENIRLIAQTGGRALELIMGDTNYSRRYQTFLSHYPEIQKRSPNLKTLDLRLDGRILAKD